MGGQTTHAWSLARQQHGVVARRQLLSLGFHPRAIEHRVRKGRLHPVWTGVYAVGRPELNRQGRWMAAVLACGLGAALSHESAAALFGIRDAENGRIEISVPTRRDPHRPGLIVHRRAAVEVERRRRIPVTTPVCTLVDLATRLTVEQLERAVNQADILDLTDPEALRSALDGLAGRPGVAMLRSVLDRHTFTPTDSELEQRFLPLAQSAGLPLPETRRYLNSFKVDFHWRELGLVVEADSLRYHRTPAQQARDRRRDQAHAAAGLTTLRFTHAQITFEPDHVRATLSAVARRLRDTATGADPLRMGSAG
jgi:very-short-patch-repair endonuclease